MSEQRKMDLPEILIMTSVEAEKDALERGLNGSTQFKVALTGVGPARAAARTATELAEHSYRYVINAGIAGGFKDKAPVTSIVVASEIVAADLGSESEEGFLPVDELGLGQAAIQTAQPFSSDLERRLRENEKTVTLAPILTLATVTGTSETTNALQQRFPIAAAEAMEGHGVATAADLAGIPVLEVRAISNEIGPRNREAWKIKEALQALERVGRTLTEVFS